MDTLTSNSELRAAVDGEAGIVWHVFLDALGFGEQSTVDSQISNLLSVGATSGADALTSIIDTFIATMETKKKHVVS